MTTAVFGARGRVGSLLCEMAKKRGHNVIPVDVDGLPEPTPQRVDVAIDFSVAEATESVCLFCEKHRCALVTGVTGRNRAQQKQIDDLSKELPVIQSVNFSEGAETLCRLVKEVAQTLASWDVEIVEIHRREKRDAPSGTAKKLAAAAAQNRNFKSVTVHSLRCGSNFGNHSVIFATKGESLTLTHQAENCEIFARGALLKAESIVSSAQNIPDGKDVGAVDDD